MKLATILILSFILMGFVGSVAGTYYYYSQSQELLESRVIDDLQSTASALENFINEVVEEQGEKLEIAATQGDLTVEELKEIKDLQEEFYEIFVLDSNGIITASSDETQIGKDKSDDAYFINARTESYIKPAYSSESTNQDSIAVSTPFHGGVLVARMSLEGFNEIVSDRTGFGETGEVLLAYHGDDGYAVFFTERRFSETSGEGTGILPIDAALAGEEKLILGSYDYRDVKVIAVTRHIDKMRVGMVVKFDEAEAIGIARNQLIKTSIIIIIAILISFSIAGYIISRLVSKPLKKMTSDVDEITKGKLDLQLPKSSIWEVQNLTNSLNRILASLKLAILKTGSKATLGLEEAVKDKEVAESKTQLFKDLLDYSNDAIYVINPSDGKFLDVNKRATIDTGYTREELLNMKVSNLDTALADENAMQKLLETISRKKSIIFNGMHRGKGGKLFPVEVSINYLVRSGKAYIVAVARKKTGVSPVVSKPQLVAKAPVKEIPRPTIKKTVPPVAKSKMGSIEKKLQERADEISRKRIKRTLGNE